MRTKVGDRFCDEVGLTEERREEDQDEQAGRDRAEEDAHRP